MAVATVSSLNFPLSKTITSLTPNRASRIKCIVFKSKNISTGLSITAITESARKRSPIFRVRALEDGESGVEKAEEGGVVATIAADVPEGKAKEGGVVATIAADAPEEKAEEGGVVATIAADAPEEKPKELSEVDKLKKALIDKVKDTDRGLLASSDTKAEILELITQLESKNPTPAPTEALTLLNGKWILAYTSYVGLFPLFAEGTLSLVKVAEVSQTIDSENSTVHNSFTFTEPLASTSLSSDAKFEVRSPKSLQLKFDEGIIGTPHLTDSIVLPENIEFLGQKVDLAPLKGFFTSVQDAASSIIKTLTSQAPLEIPLADYKVQSWLLTTYLDEELRISKGDDGSVFVLIKEGSSLLAT